MRAIAAKSDTARFILAGMESRDNSALASGRRFQPVAYASLHQTSFPTSDGRQLHSLPAGAYIRREPISRFTHG
jgi:hypothetical protein